MSVLFSEQVGVGSVEGGLFEQTRCDSRGSSPDYPSLPSGHRYQRRRATRAGPSPREGVWHDAAGQSTMAHRLMRRAMNVAAAKPVGARRVISSHRRKTAPAEPGTETLGWFGRYVMASGAPSRCLAPQPS
jgi:hypothetical protein